MVGTGILAVCGAVTTGFMNSVGEKAGQTYLATTPSPSPSIAPNSASSDIPSASAPSGGLAPDPNARAPAGAKSQVVPDQSSSSLESEPTSIIVDEIDLSFGAEASASTRARACSDAIRTATRRAENQCQSIAQEQKASGFELSDFDKSCSQCGELASGWRCVTRLKPVCKIYD